MPQRTFANLLRFLKGITFRILFFNILIILFAVFSYLSINDFERLMLTELEINLNEQVRRLSNDLGWQDSLEKRKVRNVVDAQPWAYRSYVQVFDKTGFPVFQTDPNKWDTGPDPDVILQEPLYKLTAGFFRLFSGTSLSTISNQRDIHRKEMQDVTKALRGEHSTRIIRNGFPKAKVAIVGTRPISAGKTVIGAVRVHRSANRVLMAVYQFRSSMLKTTLALLSGTLVLNIILSLTILKPIKKLTSETKTILQFKHPGEIDSLKPISGFDEIKQLSHTMSLLTDKLANEIVQHREFVDDLVHEMNNPLTAIRSAYEMSDLADSLDDKQRFRQMIATNMARIEKLLSSVKDLNHIKSSRIEQRPPEVDIAELTTRYVDNVKEILPTKLVLTVNKNYILKAHIDKDRYIQLLDNLVQNAVSFSPESEPVDIKVNGNPYMISLEVKDRGIGIPPKNITKIFERFFSLRQHNQSEKHSGLGLAIVKSIVENNGGCISATNRPQGGSCFKVTLPSA